MRYGSTSSRLLCSLSILSTSLLSLFADAQCTPRWISGGDYGGPNNIAYAMTLWDPDGPGPRAPLLVVGGNFDHVNGFAAGRIATWDGTTWSTLGGGLGYNTVYALAVMPNGDLIAGGDFSAAGGAPANRIARWDGTSWSPLGAGVNNVVYALTVTPAGDLLVGGLFTTAGGVAASRVARWTPSTQTWSTFGAGVNFTVYALAALPGGDMVTGGNFTTAGGISARFIAKWKASTSTWSAMGSTPMNNLVTSLVVLPSGQVVAGGAFTTANGFPTNNIARWDGSNWQPLGAGGMNAYVQTLALMPDGNLLAGGSFTTAGGGVAATRVAMWNTATSTWSAIGLGFNGIVDSLATFNGEPIAGGNFQTTGTDYCPFFGHYGQPVPPAVISKPADAILCANQQSPFEISCAGSPPFTYQWQILTGPGIWTALTLDPISLPCGGSAYAAGATARQASISLFPCPQVSTYQVRCAVSNSCGSAVSDAALLTMNSDVAPTDPLSVDSCLGGAAEFSTSASGFGPFTYLWLKDNQPINIEANPSAATANLILTNLTPEDAAQYNCLVHNFCSSAYTNYAMLTLGGLNCCLGDYNQDGGIDGSDVGAFFIDWEAGSAAADVNQDGGIDGSDVSTFFEHWEAGC